MQHVTAEQSGDKRRERRELRRPKKPRTLDRWAEENGDIIGAHPQLRLPSSQQTVGEAAACVENAGGGAGARRQRESEEAHIEEQRTAASVARRSYRRKAACGGGGAGVARVHPPIAHPAFLGANDGIN